MLLPDHRPFFRRFRVLLEQMAPGAVLQPLVDDFLTPPGIPEVVVIVLAGEDEDVDDGRVEQQILEHFERRAPQ